MLFGEDEHGWVYVFGINTQAWKGIFVWSLFAFAIEAPDVGASFRTAGIFIAVMVALCWFVRLFSWALGKLQ